MITLYRVHKATHFTTIDPRGALGDLPAENAHQLNVEISPLQKKADSLRRKMREKKEKKEQSEREAKEAAVKEEEERPPMNIVLFYADDWRHDTLGAAGNPVVKTPVLDALATATVR